MKHLRSIAFLSLIAVAPLTSLTAAVDPAIVPADARWVIYADLNALRSTSLGKELVGWAQKAQLEASPVGLNVEKLMATVGTMTAYGSNFSPDPKALDGTLVLQGTPDLRKIAESLLLQQSLATPEQVSESKELPFPSYVIRGKTKDGSVMTAPGLVVAFPPEGTVLIGKSKTQLVKAHEAFRGAGATIAKTAGATLKPMLGTSRDAYLFAATMVPQELQTGDNKAQARILKMAESGTLALGERGNNTFARAELRAPSDEMADKLMKIVQGWVAMLSLAESNDRQLGEFLNAASVARDDRSVTVNISYPTERLAAMLHSLQQTQSKRTPEEITAARAAQLIQGKAIDEWQAEAGGDAGQVAWRTIDNVELKNGTVVTLGRNSNGGKPVRFDRVELVPASGGAALTFRPEYMRTTGQRGNLSVFEFPGADGTYTVKVAYVNDPEGKARYAVSVRNAQPAAKPAAK